MPKFEKSTNKKLIKGQDLNDQFAFRSLLVGLILGGIFFLISILFNVADILSLTDLMQNAPIVIVDIVIKVISPLLFFFFMIISLGNYKNLLGKPLDWKDLFILFILSLFQTIRNSTVFGITLLALLGIVFYIYITQEN